MLLLQVSLSLTVLFIKTDVCFGFIHNKTLRSCEICQVSHFRRSSSSMMAKVLSVPADRHLPFAGIVLVAAETETCCCRTSSIVLKNQVN